MSLLADESVVLVIVIVLGVPLESVIIVHVKVGLTCRLIIVLKVGEIHGHAGHPLNPLVPVVVQATDEVVGAVLRVDRVEHALDKVGLLHGQDVGEVGSHLVAEAYSEIRFGIGKGIRCWLRDKSGFSLEREGE